MITIDANAIVKLAITEKDSDKAYMIINSETSKENPLFAPDIILAEALNAIWVNFGVKKKISEKNVDEAFDILTSIFGKIETIPTGSIANLAMDISKKHKLSFYDSLYVAVSLMHNSPLLTFDKKIVSKAKDLGIILAWADH